MRYFIKTFGCQQNTADSERVAAAFKARGMTKAKSYQDADYIIINTCMVRESAENRVYGLINNLIKLKSTTCHSDPAKGGGGISLTNKNPKIILTGCMVGMTYRDKTGKYLQRLKTIMPQVDEFLPIEEIGFDNYPLRTDKISAWVPISNGCNNFCTYCVVPYTRGQEISRPYEEIIKECKKLKKQGLKNITLLGQNVNSYGADLILGKKIPYLLNDIAKMGFEKVDFMSSNPWDFSDELIEIIAKNKNITRTIHLPMQSGDNNVLKRMNRWYTSGEYLKLIAKLKLKIKNLKLTTDIIVGFCGETDREFENTVKLCKKVNFEKAYISMYSPRPMTYASKNLKDDIPYPVKKKRWLILENLINQQ